MPATLWRVRWKDPYWLGERFDGVRENVSRVRAQTEPEAIERARHCFKIPTTIAVSAEKVQAEGTRLHQTQQALREQAGFNLQQRDSSRPEKGGPNPYNGGWF